MTRYILIFAIITFCSCDKKDDCIDESQIQDDVACAADYNPVCGCNQQSYPNACFASVSGVESWTEGLCQD